MNARTRTTTCRRAARAARRVAPAAGRAVAARTWAFAAGRAPCEAAEGHETVAGGGLLFATKQRATTWHADGAGGIPAIFWRLGAAAPEASEAEHVVCE